MYMGIVHTANRREMTGESQPHWKDMYTKSGPPAFQFLMPYAHTFYMAGNIAIIC
jgi:hypothetical protein